jgi:hypothetical protein
VQFLVGDGFNFKTLLEHYLGDLFVLLQDMLLVAEITCVYRLLEIVPKVQTADCKSQIWHFSTVFHQGKQNLRECVVLNK